MRYLSTQEVSQVQEYLERAIQIALKSPCEKSKRGVVIVAGNEIISEAFNGPPQGLICKPDYCKEICRDYTVHAEERAIFQALKEGKELSLARMYHVKVKNGVNVPTGGPSCTKCSKIVLEAKVQEFVLQQEEGLVLYGAREFHELSLASLKPFPIVD